MDKEVLIQHCEMKAEIKDIRSRKEKLEKEIGRLGIVSDTVKGTRLDGTYGSIKITGYPRPEYYRKRAAIERHKKLLEEKEAELLELTAQAEEYIEGISKSELRTMFRLYYIDGLPWWKVAQAMNRLFPKRRVKFTEDSCKKEIRDFLKMSPNVLMKFANMLSCGSRTETKASAPPTSPQDTAAGCNSPPADLYLVPPPDISRYTPG